MGLVHHPALRLDVIIPCWGDAPALAATLAGFGELRAVAAESGDELNVVVADASPESPASASSANVHVRCPTPGRGGQMNAGARAGRGEALLFHHVDTGFGADHLRALLGALREAGEGEPDGRLLGGAFRRRFDADHPHLRFLERLANRMPGAFFGDQSVWVRREVFTRLGGFREIPLMEDVDFARRLRRLARREGGRLALLEPAVVTSARRYLRDGPRRTSLRNAAFVALFFAGVAPRRLHRWYYRRRAPGS